VASSQFAHDPPLCVDLLLDCMSHMPRHVVVDGSNLATEGRQMPSLRQLAEAVETFMAENPDDIITVVVDATFGHRIPQNEVAEFDEAIANNELVCPPAGAVGRGDAFVLSIANKVNAAILTNDSYQEFHGQYAWLFDEGRLIGGKPVPNVGWVFVTRTPVRGVISRKAVKDARRGSPKQEASRKHGHPVRASKEANQPMPVPKAPPPGMRTSRSAQAAPVASAAPAAPAKKAPPRTGEPLNELVAFIEFVSAHPVGAHVSAVVESFGSHGANLTVGDINCYTPLRNLADPPPRSAREVLKVGEAFDMVVVAFKPDRRGVDLAWPDRAAALIAELPPSEPIEMIDDVDGDGDTGEPKQPAKKARRARKAAASKAAEVVEAPAPGETPPVAPKSKKRAAKKAAAETSAAAPDTPMPDAAAPTDAPAPAKKVARRTAAKKAASATALAAEPTIPAKKAAAKKAPAKKTAAKKAAVKKPAKKAAAPPDAPPSA
jgi:hypothetical protein